MGNQRWKEGTGNDCPARYVDAVAGEDRLPAVEGKRVGVLSHEHLREQARSREAPCNGARWQVSGQNARLGSAFFANLGRTIWKRT